MRSREIFGKSGYNLSCSFQKTISTPIISAELVNNTDMEFARKVKGRIEKTTLGEISSYIEEVYKPEGCFLLVKLDLNRIKVLGLEINLETIESSLISSKLRLKKANIQLVGSSFVIIHPDASKCNQALNVELQRLMASVPGVVVAGLPQVSRAVIAIDDTHNPPTYKLCVEGAGLRDVMGTYGVVGTKTKSNNILEVNATLGIEAARTTIMTEITDVMEGHGMTVDHRHIMLLASQMTSRGEVLGITRHGLAKMRESVFNLASVSWIDFILFYWGLITWISCSSRKPLTIYSTPPTTDRWMRLTVSLRESFWECLPLSALDSLSSFRTIRTRCFQSPWSRCLFKNILFIFSI